MHKFQTANAAFIQSLRSRGGSFTSAAFTRLGVTPPPGSGWLQKLERAPFLVSLADPSDLRRFLKQAGAQNIPRPALTGIPSFKSRIMPGDRVTIYPHGCCNPNPGAGGWAAILEFCGEIAPLAGGVGDTTNNRMELTAIREGINAAKALGFQRAEIVSDSEYCIGCLTHWTKQWKLNPARAGRKENLDMLMPLESLVESLDINFRWVKGTQGCAGNIKAVSLATQAMKGTTL